MNTVIAPSATPTTTRVELAVSLGVASVIVEAMIRDGRIPAPITIDGVTGWPPDVVDWIRREYSESLQFDWSGR